MEAKDVPLVLFIECSDRFGKKEIQEARRVIDGFAWRIRELKTKAVIGFREEVGENPVDSAHFRIWPYMPSESETGFLLSIMGGPKMTGGWSSSEGPQMRETVWADFRPGSLDLSSVDMMLVGWSIMKATTLTAFNPNCTILDFGTLMGRPESKEP